MGRWLVAGLCLLFVCGCENQQVKEMQSSNEMLTDPALDSFENEHLLGAGYAAGGERPNWAEVKRIVSSEGFKAGIAAFESAPLPSGGDAAKKTAVVDAAKKLSTAASNEEVEAAYKELMAAKTAYRS